jgi:putative Holliday junction resolvase
VRALGLDVGMKTIGVALSDALGLAGHPLTTLRRAGTAPDVAALAALVAEHAVEVVVVGWPLELSGAEGPRCKRVAVLRDALRARLGDAVLSRAKRKAVVDRSAAAYILQGWLDANRPK